MGKLDCLCLKIRLRYFISPLVHAMSSCGVFENIKQYRIQKKHRHVKPLAAESLCVNLTIFQNQYCNICIMHKNLQYWLPKGAKVICRNIDKFALQSRRSFGGLRGL